MSGRRVPVVGAIALAVALVVHIVVVASVASQARPIIWPLHNDTIYRPGPAVDFFSVYHASVNLTHGLSPYGLDPDGRTPCFYQFRYLPAVAEAGRVLLPLSPMAAYRLWIAILEGALAALILVLWRRTAGWKRTFAACCLLVSSPYFLELYMGQFTFAATVLLVMTLLTSVCAFYVLAALLKTFPLAAGVALVRAGRWRCLAVAIGVVALVTVPYFARHPGDWAAFYKANFEVSDGVGGGLHSGNVGFAFLLYSILNDLHVGVDWPTFTKLLHGVILIATAAAVLLSRERRVVLGASAMVLAHFVGYAHVWEHHMSAVLVIALVLLASLEKERKLVAVCAVCSVVLALPTPFGLLDTVKDPDAWDPALHWSLYKSYLILLPKALPTAVLYAASVVTVCRAGFQTARASSRMT